MSSEWSTPCSGQNVRPRLNLNLSQVIRGQINYFKFCLFRFCLDMAPSTLNTFLGSTVGVGVKMGAGHKSPDDVLVLGAITLVSEGKLDKGMVAEAIPGTMKGSP